MAEPAQILLAVSRLAVRVVPETVSGYTLPVAQLVSAVALPRPTQQVSTEVDHVVASQVTFVSALTPSLFHANHTSVFTSRAGTTVVDFFVFLFVRVTGGLSK